MTVYGYGGVSVREPEDKKLNSQVERFVCTDCAMLDIP